MFNAVIFLILSLGDGLLLPADIGNVASIQFKDDRMVVFDSSDQSLHLFDKNGQRLESYRRVGQLPGEYTKLSKHTTTADGYAILDHQQRRLIFLDRDLKYQRQMHFQLGVAYGVAVHSDHVFLYLVSLSKDRLVHRFDANMTYQNSFGPNLKDYPIPRDPGALFQFGAGQLVYSDKHDFLVTASYYFARIGLYTVRGDHLQTFEVPTVPQEQPNKGIAVKQLMIDDEGRILVPLVKYKTAAETIKSGLWRLDPRNGAWSVYHGSFLRIVLKPDGQFIQAKQRDDERWVLVPKEVSFEPMN